MKPLTNNRRELLDRLSPILFLAPSLLGFGLGVSIELQVIDLIVSAKAPEVLVIPSSLVSLAAVKGGLVIGSKLENSVKEKEEE